MDRNLAYRIVEFAMQAPSVHNSQPWRFVRTDSGLDLFADRDRQLTVLDPDGRQLVVSCGAALGVARLAVAALGYSCTVELLPDQCNVDHLARLSVGAPTPATEDDLVLIREIGRRRTVRDRFAPVPLTSAARTVLGAAAEQEGGWLQWLDDVAGQAALAVLTDRASRIEQADPAMRAELSRWMRRDDTGTDGIAPATLPELPAALRTADVAQREFRPVPGGPAGADPQHLPLPPERPDIAVLCTRFDGPTSWLQAGQALIRLLLRATSLGIAASPVGQALDLAWTRRRLRVELRLAGHPQMVLRLGHARLDGPRSARRPVADVLVDRP